MARQKVPNIDKSSDERMTQRDFILALAKLYRREII